MDKIWMSQDWEYRGFFTSDPILKITVIFKSSPHKFMHVENKVKADHLKLT